MVRGYSHCTVKSSPLVYGHKAEWELCLKTGLVVCSLKLSRNTFCITNCQALWMVTINMTTLKCWAMANLFRCNHTNKKQSINNLIINHYLFLWAKKNQYTIYITTHNYYKSKSIIKVNSIKWQKSVQNFNCSEN